jgi:hypothetical protein
MDDLIETPDSSNRPGHRFYHLESPPRVQRPNFFPEDYPVVDPSSSRNAWVWKFNLLMIFLMLIMLLTDFGGMLKRPSDSANVNNPVTIIDHASVEIPTDLAPTRTIPTAERPDTWIQVDESYWLRLAEEYGWNN